MSSSAKRLKEIEAIQDQDVDYSEIPEADEGFWERVGLEMPQPKRGISAWIPTSSTGRNRRAGATRSG